MIDRATVDKIIDAARIVDVVGEFVTLRKAGVNYKGLCPFHDDRNPSFMVSPAKNICHCFVRRIYNKKESSERLKKLFSYYQETSVIFPNYTPLIESKYLYNNVIRKQRIIDEQQNLEEYKKYLVNKEKKKNKQNSPLKAIENIFEQDINEEEVSRVFNSKAYDEILNTTESIKRIVFGIENDKTENNNIKNNEKDKESDSVKKLIMKIDKLSGHRQKNNDKNDIDLINKVKKKLKYTAKLLTKNKDINLIENKTKSFPKERNNSLKKSDKKEPFHHYKKNRTININININNTKNNIAMTDRPILANNSHNYNSNFPFTTRDISKEKRVIFNQKKIQSTYPYQIFRCSNLISNLNKKSKNNNTNNNSINMLQQKLIEIFNKKIKKNKNNRNNSYNLSLSKNSNTSRLRTKNRAFIISTIQNILILIRKNRKKVKGIVKIILLSVIEELKVK